MIKENSYFSLPFGRAYGVVERLLVIDITKQIKEDVNPCQKGMYHFKDESCILAYLPKGFASAEIVVNYCNPQAYSRRSRNTYCGRPTHYIQCYVRFCDEEDIILQTQNCNEIIKKTKEEALEALNNYLMENLKKDFSKTNKELNFTVFSLIHAEAQKSKFKSVTSTDIIKNHTGYLKQALQESIDVLKAKGFIETKRIQGTKNNIPYDFFTIKPTEKGIERLQNIIDK